MSESPMKPAPNDIEAVLSTLSPAVARLDRDQLMYAAGIAAANRRARRFQLWGFISTAALLFVSTGFAYLAVLRSEPREVVKIVYADSANQDETNLNAPLTQSASSKVTPDVQISELSYLRLRNQILTHGVDSLPELPISGQGTGEPQQSLKAGSRELPEELFGI